MSYKFNPFTGTFDLVGGSSGGGGQAPFFIKSTETYTVEENRQVPFVKRIFIEDGGRIVLGGILVEAR